MTAYYLSRAFLRRDARVAAIAPQLLPDDDSARANAAHRLIWSLFAGDEQAQRCFLFRETQAPGRLGARATFMILSDRPPDAGHPVMEVETKPFAPVLTPGDRLQFSLRANATVTRNDANGRLKRHDIVMDALTRAGLGSGARASARREIIREAGLEWLSRLGERAGFRPVLEAPADMEEDEGEAHGRAPIRIDGYSRWSFARLGPKGGISVLDFDGLIEIAEPERFLGELVKGFGRAKAYGCGLMLIRRA